MNSVIISKDAAAHDIEQHVGKVMCRAQAITQFLQTVCAGDNSDQVGCTLFNILKQVSLHRIRRFQLTLG